MVRRFANQVHQQVSRLMRANYIKKEPAWYQAVLQYPPLPLPPKAPASRTQYDHTSRQPDFESGQPVKLRRLKTRPLPIQYIEDDIRRQFFRDHPFEAFRPKTLVEGAGIEPPHAIRGKSWKRLRQRGRNPSPEDAIQFAVNLHLYGGNKDQREGKGHQQKGKEPQQEENEPGQEGKELQHEGKEPQQEGKEHQHEGKEPQQEGEEHQEGEEQQEGMPISEAYLRAVAQFRALRSEHHIASTFAAIEAEAFGYTFEKTEVEKLFAKHIRELKKWGQEEEFDDESANAAKKRWRAIVERTVEQGEWTKGEKYVQLWKDNAKAEYAPTLTQPITERLAAETIENRVTTS